MSKPKTIQEVLRRIERTIGLPDLHSFSLRCYRQRRRCYAERLTPNEARCFRVAARHLAQYLTKEYRLGR